MLTNACGILVSRFRILLSTMEKRLKVVIDIVFTFVVLHNMLRTHQHGTDRSPNPANNVAAIQNEQVMYVPNENSEILRGRPNFKENY